LQLDTTNAPTRARPLDLDVTQGRIVQQLYEDLAARLTFHTLTEVPSGPGVRLRVCVFLWFWSS